MSESTTETLRQEYEAAVRALQTRIEAMRQDARPIEDIARAAHGERRKLAAIFKARTPEPMRTLIHQRTLAAYGDSRGPTIEALRAKGKTWKEIVESSTRPGRLDWIDGG